MTDPGFRILLIASAMVLVLVVIDVVWLIRTRHAAVPMAEGPPSGRLGGSREADPARTDPAGTDPPRSASH